MSEIEVICLENTNQENNPLSHIVQVTLLTPVWPPDYYSKGAIIQPIDSMVAINKISESNFEDQLGNISLFLL